jgi:hypothetical protein
MNNCYYNENNLKITNRKLIFYNYLKSFLILDILSCLPTYFIVNSLKDNKFQANKLLRILKIAKILRLLKVIKIIKLFTNLSRDNLINKIL